MKSIKSLALTFLGGVLVTSMAFAQNYKAPKIDASGMITDEMGMSIGSITKEGEVKDTKGVKIAYIDNTGELIDAKTGKKLGKAQKNGNFTPYFNGTPDKATWTTSAPANGTCYVKGEDGKVKAVVHENYKMYGACAIHCLQNGMNHDEVMDKKETAMYTCSMHPDVTSDKPGKCSKCGMNLTKK